MKYILLDIDNCISDDAWRIPRIAWQHTDKMRRYHDYHLLSGFDRCVNRHLFQSPLTKIVLLTGRPVMYYALTEEWLRREASIERFTLLMRNNYDFRSSVEVKRSQLGWLSEYGIHLSNVVMAYDDRQEIVTMYKEFGLNAKVVNIHNQDAYHNPLTQENAL